MTKHRKIALDETISSIGPKKLESTRKTINEEIASARAKIEANEKQAAKDIKERVVAAVAIGESNPPAPQQYMVVMDEEEVERRREADDARIAADDARNEKLDLITDIQLILVNRFQTLFRALVALVIVSMSCMGLGIYLGFVIKRNVEDSIADQQALIEAQRESKEEIAKKVDDTAQKVEDTAQKVKEVAETVPQVEVDPATGKKSLVVSEKKDENGESDGDEPPEPAPQEYPPKPSWHKPAPPPPPKGKIRMDVEGL